MPEHLGDGSAHGLLELLGDLARHRNPAVFAENLGELLETPDHAVGRFVENHRALLAGKRLQLLHPPLLLGQEALEAETVARKPALHQRRNQRRGAGQRLDLDPRLDARAHQQEPGVRNAGRPGVRHQGGIASRGDRPGDHFDRGVLVELVVRTEFLLDAEVLQQERRRARVLGEDEIHLAQDVHRAQRDVVQIPDRRRYDIEFGHRVRRICVRAVPS